MKRQLCTLAVLGAFAAPAFADHFTVDPVYTVPAFEVGHLGFTTQTGRFNKVAGDITLDTAAKKGSVELTIYTNSIDMATPAWSAHLMSEGLFNVDKYPTMTFKSHHLEFSDGKVVGADGEFTLLGVTKPLHVAVNGFHCGTVQAPKRYVCGADVTAKIKRSEFGLTKYIPEVSDEIEIRVPIEAYKD
jgi:polyisoprenoid-binding protein YceI